MTPAECLERIRAYTQQHPELREAHHFLFDLPITEKRDPVDVLVMGMNPGESPSDFDICDPVAEESSAYDFHERDGAGRDHIPWHRRARTILRGTGAVQTEAFFWSSEKSGAKFRARFGTPIERSPHLKFCTEMNTALIAHHQPKVVVAVGLAMECWLPGRFGLRYVDTRFTSDGDSRVVECFTDGTRPWLLTKHWTGAWLSEGEEKLIQQEIRAHLGSGRASPLDPLDA